MSLRLIKVQLAGVMGDNWSKPHGDETDQVIDIISMLDHISLGRLPWSTVRELQKLATANQIGYERLEYLEALIKNRSMAERQQHVNLAQHAKNLCQLGHTEKYHATPWVDLGGENYRLIFPKETLAGILVVRHDRSEVYAMFDHHKVGYMVGIPTDVSEFIGKIDYTRPVREASPVELGWIGVLINQFETKLVG